MSENHLESYVILNRKVKKIDGYLSDHAVARLQGVKVWPGGQIYYFSRAS